MLMPISVASSLPSANTTTTSVIPMDPTITTSIQPFQTPLIQKMEMHPLQTPLHQKTDTTMTKLFVGGLPYHTTDKTLREHFEEYGEIEEAVVITDRSTGKSKGYGFVIMATKETAELARKQTNPIIDGRKANVNLAVLGAKPRGNSTALRPTLTTNLLQSQYGDMTLAGLGPGKARSSMNLHMMSGRGSIPQNNPASAAYLQQLYAASSPYGLLSLGGMQPTGNPVLDMYAQYAAQLQAAQFPGGVPSGQLQTGQYPGGVPAFQLQGGQFPASVAGAPSASNSPPLDSQQSAMTGSYLPPGYTSLPPGFASLPPGFTYAPFTSQQVSGVGQSPGIPAGYVAQAGPTQAAISYGPQQPKDEK